MSTNCSMCGHEVRVVSGDEGTSHYEPVEATERWTRLTGERSAGAAPIDVDALEDAMDEVASRTDGRGLGHVHWEYAGLVVDEYNLIRAARLASEGTDSPLDVERLGEAMAKHSLGVGFGHSTDSCGPGCAGFVLARLSEGTER